jgi:hypothetical protein
MPVTEVVAAAATTSLNRLSRSMSLVQGSGTLAQPGGVLLWRPMD